MGKPNITAGHTPRKLRKLQGRVLPDFGHRGCAVFVEEAFGSWFKRLSRCKPAITASPSNLHPQLSNQSTQGQCACLLCASRCCSCREPPMWTQRVHPACLSQLMRCGAAVRGCTSLSHSHPLFDYQASACLLTQANALRLWRDAVQLLCWTGGFASNPQFYYHLWRGWGVGCRVEQADTRRPCQALLTVQIGGLMRLPEPGLQISLECPLSIQAAPSR